MGDAATYIVILCAGFLLGVLVRAWPRMRVRGTRGDAFYELVLVRALKKQKRVPVYLDNYMLDTGAQCTPPGFPVLLALLPKSVAWRWPWLVNPVLDAAVGAALGGLMWAHGARVMHVACAVLAWALTPVLVRTCAALNRRMLGNTLLVLCMLLLIQALLSGSQWSAVLAAGAGAVLLLSHRRSAQTFVFTALGLAVWRMSWAPVAILGMSFLGAGVLSAGFFVNILRGNIQWLIYRRRNWKRMRAHMVYDAPAYARDSGVGGAAAAARHTGPGRMRGVAGGAARLLARNFLLPVFLLAAWGEFAWWTEFERLLAAWAALVYLWAALTAFLPFLRFLGAGVRYEKMAAFPMIYLTVEALGWGAPWWLLPLFVAAVALNAWQVWVLYAELSAEPPSELGIGPVLAALRRDPADGVLVLPPGMCESWCVRTHPTGPVSTSPP